MASAHFRMGSLGLWDRVGLTQGRCPSSGLRHGSRTAGGMGPWVAPRTPGSRRSLGLLCAVWRDSHAGPSAASRAPAVGCPVVAGQWRRCSRDQAAPPGEVVPVVRLRGEGLGAENQETRQIEGAPDGPDAREWGRRPDTQPRRRSASAPTPPAPVPPLQEEALASQETREASHVPGARFRSCGYGITCFLPAKPVVLRGPGPPVCLSYSCERVPSTGPGAEDA